MHARLGSWWSRWTPSAASRRRAALLVVLGTGAPGDQSDGGEEGGEDRQEARLHVCIVVGAHVDAVPGRVEVESWQLSWTFGSLCARRRRCGAGRGDDRRDARAVRDVGGSTSTRRTCRRRGRRAGAARRTFLVGYRDGDAVCGGGIKRLPDGACEIKRMYVVPAARRQGWPGSAARARGRRPRLGYDVARLDTGPRQPHARGSTSRGLPAIANFNGNPVATFFGEKRLSG